MSNVFIVSNLCGFYDSYTSLSMYFEGRNYDILFIYLLLFYY